MNPPRYIYSDPEKHAQTIKEKMLNVGCSEAVAEAERLRILSEAVKVGSAYEANMLQRGASA